jgi:hypothetical protein
VSDDVGTERESGPRDSEAVRDDIMKRLLEYQRRQQGEANAASSVWATPPVKAPEAAPVAERHAEEAPTQPETPAETPVEDEAPAAPSELSPEVQARVETLQGALDRVASQIAELRQTFQDMAIAADERLADIESEIARSRTDEQQGS